MSAPFHRRSEKRGARRESAGDAQPHLGWKSSHSSLLFTLSSPTLYLVAALMAALAVACGSEPAPEPAPLQTPTAAPLVAPTATPVAPSAESSRERSMAPNFSLPSAGGNDVSLSGLLEDHRAVVLVFYRGYF